MGKVLSAQKTSERCCHFFRVVLFLGLACLCALPYVFHVPLLVACTSVLFVGVHVSLGFKCMNMATGFTITAASVASIWTSSLSDLHVQ